MNGLYKVTRKNVHGHYCTSLSEILFLIARTILNLPEQNHSQGLCLNSFTQNENLRLN